MACVINNALQFYFYALLRCLHKMMQRNFTVNNNLGKK